jgi:predicted phosphodiesterase
MRYGIFSDIHSNLEAFNAVIDAYKKEAIDTYLCIGDCVGYAGNPKECIEKAKAIATITVAGNHDWAAVDLFSLDYFNPKAKEAIIWTQGKLDDSSRYFLESIKLIYKNEYLTLVHGTLDNPGDFQYLTDKYIAKETFRLMETDVCFVGHTHIAGVFIKDKLGKVYYQQDDFSKIEPENKYIVNVGSVGQPRDGNPKAAYSIYDTERKEVQIKRISYDIQTTVKKIYAAGLPEFLGQRLLSGR